MAARREFLASLLQAGDSGLQILEHEAIAVLQNALGRPEAACRGCILIHHDPQEGRYCRFRGMLQSADGPRVGFASCLAVTLLKFGFV